MGVGVCVCVQAAIKCTCACTVCVGVFYFVLHDNFPYIMKVQCTHTHTVDTCTHMPERPSRNPGTC